MAAAPPTQFSSFSQALRSGFVTKDDQGNLNLTREARMWLQGVENKTSKSLSLEGQVLAAIQNIAADASVSGRTASLQTLLQNLQDSGAFNSLGNVTDTSTDHLTDGTGTPLTGGKRGAQALDSDNRLVSSFHQNQVDVTATPLSSTQLSNDGVTTLIVVDAGSYQYGPGQIPYNSGSIDPGVFGSFYVFFDDPTFQGGAVMFQFSTTPVDTVANIGRQVVGGITTLNGTGHTGGGNTGGSSGKGGGRGYNTL